MNILHKKKGVTMIEAIIALSLVGGITVGSVNYAVEALEDAKYKKHATMPLQIIKAIDRRIEIDGYNSTFWSGLPTANNTDDLINYALHAFIPKANLKCGKIDGWIPQLEKAERDALIPCEFGQDNYNYYDYQLMTSSNVDGKLAAQDIIMKLNSKYNLVDDDLFLKHKKLKNKLKSNQPTLKAGFFSVEFVNFSNLTQNLNLSQCQALENDCAIRVSWRSDGFDEALRVDGTNNMISSHVSFVEDYNENEMSCIMWEYDNNGTYSSNGSVDCGVGLYNKTLKPLLATVDAAVDEATINSSIILDQDCKVYSKDANGYIVDNGTTSECGFISDTTMLQVVDNLQVSSELYVQDLLVADSIDAANAKIINDLLADTGSTTKLDVLFVDGTTNLKNKTSIDLLEVVGKTKFDGDVTLTGDLNVENPTGTNALEISGGNRSEIGTDSTDADLTVTGDVQVTTMALTKRNISNGNSCGDINNPDLLGELIYNGKDLLICRPKSLSPNSYIWASNRDGEIVAFNGSCPDGWDDLADVEYDSSVDPAHEQMGGRTLLGNGRIFDPSIGELTYQTGEKGGKSFVRLTEAQMPGHQHELTEAYFSERWLDGSFGNMIGGSGGQDNDNKLFTKERETETAGGDVPHDNRSPFITARYCIYRNGDKANESFAAPPPVNVDDYWYPYTDFVSDWVQFTTVEDEDCTADTYYDYRPQDREYWLRQCNVIKERVKTEREINYLTGVIRNTGSSTKEQKTFIEPEVWVRGTPYVEDWIPVGDPYNCTVKSVTPKGSDNNNPYGYDVLLNCLIDKQHVHQERLAKLDSYGNEIKYRNYGPEEKKNGTFQEDFLEYVPASDTWRECGAWYLPPSEDNKPWQPELLCPRGDTMDQHRTVYNERSCKVKARIYGIEYHLHTVKEYDREDQFLPDQPCGLIDLERWRPADSNGNWEYKGPSGGRKNYILQKTNGDSTVYQSDTNDYGRSPGKVIRGRIQVQAGAGDDDWVGFVIGKTDSNHFYLWSWKKNDQSPAYEGHALAYLTGGIRAIESGGAGMKNMHSSSSGYNVVRAYKDHDGSKYNGWNHGQEYTFRIEYSPSRMKLYINEVLIFDEPPKYTSSYPEGSVGFFNKSQGMVEYYDVSEEPLR